MKILVVAPSWIGDTVAAQPLFMRLHERHPALKLDVIAPPWVAPVLRRMPEVAAVLDHPFSHGVFGLAARRKLGLRLRGERYDEAIVLPNSWKSALVPFFAGIPKRTGFTGEARYGLLNNRHNLDKAALPQIVQRYAALADAPGEVVPKAFLAPRLRSDPAQQQAVLAGLQLERDPAPIVFCPGAEYGPAKRWPAAYFAQLACDLRDRGHSVWLIGSAKDAVVGEEIVAASAGACRNLCGRTGLDQAVDLLAAAECVVTNDSGLMHVAAALDRPLVALFGSSSPRFTPPLSDQADVVWLEIECSPCFRRECPKGHFRCMLDMRPEQVLERVDARLAAGARRA
ncbi:MAG: lipopolysaccharide heptosyltransferase II [Rhodocyclaceae bacterium]